MFRTEEQFKEWLTTLDEGTGYFVDPYYWEAIIGITVGGGIVYEYDKMVDVLIFNQGMSEEDAIEWIDYNVLRTVPYCGEIHPVIIRTFE